MLLKSLEFYLPKFAASLRHGHDQNSWTPEHSSFYLTCSVWMNLFKLSLLLSKLFPSRKLKKHFTNICHYQGSRIHEVNVKNVRKKCCFKSHGNLEREWQILLKVIITDVLKNLPELIQKLRQDPPQMTNDWRRDKIIFKSLNFQDRGHPAEVVSTQAKAVNS